MSEAVDLALLGRLCEKILDEVRGLRREVAEVRDLTILTSDYARRLDRRMMDMRDDIELVMKSEISGRLSHAETTLENAIEQLAQRVAALEPAR